MAHTRNRFLARGAFRLRDRRGEHPIPAILRPGELRAEGKPGGVAGGMPTADRREPGGGGGAGLIMPRGLMKLLGRG